MDCQDCGQCCMEIDSIMLMPSDFEKLAKIDGSLKQKIKKVDGIYYLMPTDDHVCPYFDKKVKKCTIYQWRPKVCKAYPFSYRNPPIESKGCESSQINPQTLYLTLCNRFWAFNESDYKEGIKAIFRLRREKHKLGIIRDSQKPTEKELRIKEFEQKLNYEKKEKKFPLDLYLYMIKENQNLFLMFLRMFDEYFDSPEKQEPEYTTFVKNHVIKLYSKPESLEKSFKELKNRWKENKKKNIEFSYSF